MTEQVNGEALRQQVIHTLSFIREPNWQIRLGELANNNPELKEFYKQRRLQASLGIAECMDERPVMDQATVAQLGNEFVSRSNPPKAAMVGGAAGWMMYFRLTGQSLIQAADSTKALYEKMNWGNMEVHIDNEHGHIKEAAELKARRKGCGALGVQEVALAVVSDILSDIEWIKLAEDKVVGEQYIEAVVERGGKIVPLQKNHKTNEAYVVINNEPGMTLDRNALYAENPAFLWDAGTTTTDDVRNAFNALAKTNLTAEQFYKMQAAMHLTVGLMLNAVRLGGENPNVVLI